MGLNVSYGYPWNRKKFSPNYKICKFLNMVIPGIETGLIAIVTYVLYIDLQNIFSLKYNTNGNYKNILPQQFILLYI